MWISEYYALPMRKSIICFVAGFSLASLIAVGYLTVRSYTSMGTDMLIDLSRCPLHARPQGAEVSQETVDSVENCP